MRFRWMDPTNDRTVSAAEGDLNHEIAWQRVRESNPITRLRVIARFRLKSAAISALTTFAENEEIADSRRITQFPCPNLSEEKSLCVQCR